MHTTDPFGYTQPHRPFDPDQTQPRPQGYYHYPPAPPTPPRRKRTRRRVGCLGCLFRLALAVTLFVVTFTALVASLYILFPPPRTNILMLGIDSRPGEGVATRADTIILATVDPRQPYVGMLSIPRDLYINIPGYGFQRINAAHVFAESNSPGTGPALVEQTIESNFGVPVDRFIRLDFQAFVAIVDAAGGVTIDVPFYFVDYEYPTPDYGTMVVEFQAGTQHMNGERALQYARIRHGSSDFQRAERQQQVIEALFRQLLSPANWWRWPAVYMAFSQYVDTDLTILDGIALGPALLWVGPGGIDRRILDSNMTTGRTTESGASVLEPNWGQINPLLYEMFLR